VNFSADATTHYRSATLLGKAAEVKFVPAIVTWHFGDGFSASAQSLEHRFSQPGTYAVTVRVTYTASYRIVGATDWVSGGDLSVSNQIWLSVNQSNQGPQAPKTSLPKKFVLVANNCIVREREIGCSP
jgi:PKD repeat protein